jgi:AhpD family alkylhydroperoxidase
MDEKELNEFRKYREKMNEKILSSDHLGIKRFFNLDTQAYVDGALDAKTKEMLGLVASMVLRCDDCISYHIIRCAEEKVNRAEMIEVFNIALIVGGSIVIPHMRRAFETMDQVLADLPKSGPASEA